MADVVESKEQVLIRFRDKELRGCTIKKLWLQGISLVGADLSDVTFEDCSLDEVNLTGAQLHRTKFLRTSARSTNMTSATLVYECLDWGNVAHVGGGSHGSLRREDSSGPLLFVGCGPESADEKSRWALRDVAPVIREHFGL